VHRVAAIVSGIAGILPGAIAAGLKARSPGFVFGLHGLALLLGYFGAPLSHKAAQGTIDPDGILAAPSVIEGGQGGAEVLQIANVVV